MKQSKMNAEKHYYIIKLASYQSEQSALQCTSAAGDFMYCVMTATGQGAELLDFGYPTLHDAQKAWPEALPPLS